MILTPTSWPDWTWPNKKKIFLQNTKKNISNIFKPKDNLKIKVAEQMSFIKKDKPFEDKIGEYQIEDLSKENAKSGTAFKLTDNSGNQYKLRTAANGNEARQINNIIRHNQSVMPEYLWKREIGWRIYHLFKRLKKAKEINDFSYEYKNENGISEPEEIHKKAWKVLGKVNANIMHNDWSIFREELEKRMKKINKSKLYKNKIFAIMPKIAEILNQEKKVFSQKEREDIKNFFEEHMKNPNIRFGYDLWDSHGWNFMLEEKNPHLAYAIDEWSIKEDYLIGTGIGHYINQKPITEEEKINTEEKINGITKEGVKKFLKGYYKKNQNIVFDKEYFELIHIIYCLKKIESRIKMFKNIENKNIWSLKNKLMETLEYAKNNTYICKKSALNLFVEVNEELNKQSIN